MAFLCRSTCAEAEERSPQSAYEWHTACVILMLCFTNRMASVPVANKSIIVIRIHKVLVMVSESSSRADPYEASRDVL